VSLSRPPPRLRALRLVVFLGARRWLNRIASNAGFRRRTGPAKARQATPRRQAVSGVLLGLMGVLFLFVGVFQSSRLVKRVATIGTPTELVSRNLYRSLKRAMERGLEPANMETEEREQLREQVEDDLRNFSRDRQRSQTELEQDSEALVARYERDGLSGFSSESPDFRKIDWPEGEAETPVVRTLAALFLYLGVMSVLTSLGTANQDLGRVEWSFEWLYGLPARSEILFGAKVLEYALLNPLLWFTAFPLALALYLARGLGWGALPLALFAYACLSLVSAAVRLLTETWLRMRLRNLKNLQALFTVSGTVMLVLILWLSNGLTLPSVVTSYGPRFWPTLNPCSLPAELARAGGAPWTAMVATLMAASALLVPILAVLACSHLVRTGLISTTGPLQGSRGARRPQDPTRESADRRPPFLKGALAKDLRLLRRDRNFLVQTLVFPLLLFSLQLLTNRGLLEALRTNFHHAATFAFAIGAYMLMFSAAGVLSVEGNALWLLYTLPRPLHRVLVGKALMWACIASLYTVAALTAALALNDDLGPGNVLDVVAALAGVPIYAFVAAGLGALATDPLEQEVQRRVAPSTLYLYMLLASMYAYAIYTPSLWAKLVQALLSSLLAIALWQKLRDRLPYLLDPTAAPPARLSLSDGMLAALAFFTAQGVYFLMLDGADLSRGMELFLSFALAGLTVTLGSLVLLRRARVQGLLETIGLRRTTGARQESVAVNLWLGLLAGLGAGAVGLVYLLVLKNLMPDLPEWMKTSSPLDGLGPGDAPILMLMAVLAAPLFEEYLFRGLLYRGMQRSLGTAPAIAASAALFAIVHPPVSVLPVFVLGLAAATVFQRGGLLLAPILAHATYNAIVLGVQLWGAP
jgi:ABC-2 type transport system permease protein